MAEALRRYSGKETLAVRQAQLFADLKSVRDYTVHLARNLSDADASVQSMEDASPTKWHLAHTSWFFETMLLAPLLPDYAPFDPAFAYLFNSYYEQAGPRHARPRRGMITRPGLETILAYRAHVDAALARLFAMEQSAATLDILTTGIQHEQQHQELLLTDILHLFAQNPLCPAYEEGAGPDALRSVARDVPWPRFDAGLTEIGAPETGFAFDAERPRHTVYLEAFSLAPELVTNKQWQEFMADGGYDNPLLWLSDGWARVQAECWQAPLYWQEKDGAYRQMTLRGLVDIDPNAPVRHVSYFEADAFARWAGARLPREAEWEHAASDYEPASAMGDACAITGLEPKLERGLSAPDSGLSGLYSTLWQWTQSPFAAYPGFRPNEGVLGEYNGKFMNGQFVLRGGSCITPKAQVRAAYRNFFYPWQRWQYTGVRLAKDG